MVPPFWQEPPLWTALAGYFTAVAIGWDRKEGPVATLMAFEAQWLLWCATQGLQILQKRRQKECKSQSGWRLSRQDGSTLAWTHTDWGSMYPFAWVLLYLFCFQLIVLCHSWVFIGFYLSVSCGFSGLCSFCLFSPIPIFIIILHCIIVQHILLLYLRSLFVFQWESEMGWGQMGRRLG